MFMKTSQLYNIEVLVKLYACLGAWHYLDFSFINDGALLSIFMPPIATSIFYYLMTNGYIRNVVLLMESIVILAFVADGLFRFIRFLLYRMLKGTLRSRVRFSNQNRSRWIFLLLWLLIFYLTAYLLYGEKTWLHPEFVVGIMLILLVLYQSVLLISMIPDGVPLSFRKVGDREVNFVVWMILLLPFITVGDLYVVLKGFHSWINCKMLIPVVLRLALATHFFSIATPSPSGVHMENYRMMMRLLRVGVMAYSCWKLFALHIHDEILLHPLQALVMAATSCDIVEFAFQSVIIVICQF
jgi:hypothetical protein